MYVNHSLRNLITTGKGQPKLAGQLPRKTWGSVLQFADVEAWLDARA